MMNNEITKEANVNCRCDQAFFMENCGKLFKPHDQANESKARKAKKSRYLLFLLELATSFGNTSFTSVVVTLTFVTTAGKK